MSQNPALKMSEVRLGKDEYADWLMSVLTRIRFDPEAKGSSMEITSTNSSNLELHSNSESLYQIKQVVCPTKAAPKWKRKHIWARSRS